MAVQEVRTEGKFLVEPGETSDIIHFAGLMSIVIVVVSFPEGSGQARIQTSISINDDIEKEEDIEWVDWPNGIVTTLTQDWCRAPNAMRIINESTESNEPVLVEVRSNYG